MLTYYLTIMIEALKEEVNKSLKDIQENTVKQGKEINKTVQDLKMEIESIKKTQTEGNPRDGKSREKNNKYKHHQQSTADGKENLRHRRYNRRN